MTTICYIDPPKNTSTHVVAWFEDEVPMQNDISLPSWFGEGTNFILTSFRQKYIYTLAVATPYYPHRADEKDVEDWLNNLRYGFPEATKDYISLAMAYNVPKRCVGDPEALRHVALDTHAAIMSPYTPAQVRDELMAVRAVPTNELA